MNKYISTNKIKQLIETLKDRKKKVEKLNLEYTKWILIGEIGILETLLNEDIENHISHID